MEDILVLMTPKEVHEALVAAIRTRNKIPDDVSITSQATLRTHDGQMFAAVRLSERRRVAQGPQSEAPRKPE